MYVVADDLRQDITNSTYVAMFSVTKIDRYLRLRLSENE